MTLLNKPLENMLSEIGPNSLSLDVILIPEKNGSHMIRGNAKSPTYDDIERVLKQTVEDKTSSGYCHPCLQEALSNAFGRGNKYSKLLPVRIMVYDGLYGLVVRIEDSGEGFNFKDKIRKMRAGIKHFQNMGHGIKFLDSTTWQCSYEGTGSILNIHIKSSD